MSTRSAKPRDLGQELTDLKAQVRRLMTGAMTRPPLRVTDGDFVVSGGGAVVTMDDAGGRTSIGNGNIEVWDDYNANPSGYGRIYCDPGTGYNVFRFFPPHTSGTGLENSITIQGKTPTSVGNAWVYTDGQLVLSADTTLYVDAGKVQVLTGGEFGLYELPTTGSAANMRLDTIGGVWTVGWVTSSLRYKQDVEDAVIDPADVLKMQGRTWRDKSAVANDPDTTQRHVGFIAEELDDIGLGIFVDYDTEGRPDAIQYDRLSVALVALAKSQQAQIDALTARLDAAGV